MDNTPLHPDIIPLPPDSGHRHGDFLTAIPYNRSMYRTIFLLRVASILDSLCVFGTLATMRPQDDLYYSVNWAYGGPPAGLAALWSLTDIIVMLVRDKGLRWTKNDPTKLPRSTKYSWGHAGGHVTAQLIIWVLVLVLTGLLVLNWLSVKDLPTAVQGDNQNKVAALVFWMFVLVTIHFALFVFAIVEVDNGRRNYSDVIFIPRGELCEMVPVPPSAPVEIFHTRRLPLSYFANHYVRFVPGADGTVTMARDYSSRQARF
ncbi:hypothetical protein CCHL11_02371 [Colletotrichum chlorophyti]|uniref:Uncharacterized protein n=1 Tax=Colletotrichum chlorophyti TaxID=708187 RepID=A0A1Q8S5U3_9PEZI|nr:hypothetical protein CCHL11_02371 [Colletotrichum chlorophyti]